MERQIRQPRGVVKGKIVWIVINGLIVIALVVRLTLRWHTMSPQGHWTGIAIAFIFPLLLESLMSDRDRFGSLLYATAGFLLAVFASYSLL